MAIEINGPDTAFIGWCNYEVHGYDGDLPEDTVYQWSLSGVSAKYAEENGKLFKFYVDEDTYDKVDEFYVYCNTYTPSTKAEASAQHKVTPTHKAAPTEVDVQAVINIHYPDQQYLNPFATDKLKLTCENSVGLIGGEHGMVARWTVDSGVKSITLIETQLPDGNGVEITVEDLLDKGFDPIGFLTVSITLEIFYRHGVVGYTQKLMIMPDIAPPPPPGPEIPSWPGKYFVSSIAAADPASTITWDNQFVNFETAAKYAHFNLANMFNKTVRFRIRLVSGSCNTLKAADNDIETIVKPQPGIWYFGKGTPKTSKDYGISLFGATAGTKIEYFFDDLDPEEPTWAAVFDGATSKVKLPIWTANKLDQFKIHMEVYVDGTNPPVTQSLTSAGTDTKTDYSAIYFQSLGTRAYAVYRGNGIENSINRPDLPTDEWQTLTVITEPDRDGSLRFKIGGYSNTTDVSEMTWSIEHIGVRDIEDVLSNYFKGKIRRLDLINITDQTKNRHYIFESATQPNFLEVLRGESALEVTGVTWEKLGMIDHTHDAWIEDVPTEPEVEDGK